MSVQRSTDNKASERTMSEGFAHASQGERGQPDAGFTFRSMNNGFRSAMNRTPGGEITSKLAKAIAAVCADTNKTFTAEVIPVDMNTTTSLGVSVIVLAVRDELNPDVGIAHHSFIVEASAEPLPPRIENIDGQQVKVLRLIDESYDDTMKKTILDVLERSYPQVNFIDSSACVVPRDFNFNDEAMLRDLVANALYVCSTDLAQHTEGFKDLNLANLARGENLIVRTSFGNPHFSDRVGRPVRSDIVIDFQSAPNSSSMGSQNNAERYSPISRISGYMEPVWDPAVPVQNMWQGMQPQSLQRYSARYVITSLESSQPLTPGAQLLSLLPVLALQENHQWVNAFRRTSFSNDVDMHDIGAINLEVGLEIDGNGNFIVNPNGTGKRIDTRSNSFKQEDLHRLISATFKPDIMVCMDIPRCGPETNYNEIFAAAANGVQSAYKAIYDAADTLTNGLFRKHFAYGNPIAFCNNDLVHMGYYVDKNGVRQDLRDVDYLAVANTVGERDVGMIRIWSDANFGNQHTAKRLAQKEQIITGVCGGETVITGMAYRITFSADFLIALSKACFEIGLVIRPAMAYTDFANYERATASFAGRVSLDGQGSGMFARGGMGGSMGYNQNQFTSSRF